MANVAKRVCIVALTAIPVACGSSSNDSPPGATGGVGTGGTAIGGAPTVGTATGGPGGAATGGTATGGTAGSATGGAGGATTGGTAGSATGGDGGATTGGAGGATTGGAATGGSEATTHSGAFVEEHAPKSVPPAATGGTAPPSAAGDAVTITVDPDDVERLIPPTVVGNNIAAWHGDNFILVDDAKTRLAATGLTLMRFPGGSSSDTYHWDGNVPAENPNSSAANWMNPWAVNTYEFLTLAEELGWVPLITANHGYATYGTIAEAAALAADWVEYCNAPNDGSNPNGGTDWAAQRAADGHPAPFNVKYWEVGNEVYGSWEVGYQADGGVYGANAVTISEAMRAVDSSIYIGVVGYVGEDDASAWTAQVLQTSGLGALVDFIDIHDYFQYVQTNPISAQDLLGLDVQIEEDITELRSLVNTHTGRNDVAVYLGEFGCTNPNNPHTASAVSGLFVTEVFGEVIRTGYAAASQWDVVNGWDAGRGGDHGFLAKNSPTVENLTPRPSYYASFFFGMNFGDQLVASTSSDAGVVVYASRFAGGELGLVIVNENATNRSATIDLGSFTTSGTVNAWLLTNASLDSLSVELNGVGGGQPEGGPTLDQVTPYYWDVGATSSITLDLPRHAVASVVAY